MNINELRVLMPTLQYNSKVFLNLNSSRKSFSRKLFTIKTEEDWYKIPSYEIKEMWLRANNDTLELYLDVE